MKDPASPQEVRCTKDKVANPLGVCSIFDNNKLAITCPVRFFNHKKIFLDAARFLFPAGIQYEILTEAKIKDENGSDAGKIDFVLTVLDPQDKIIDFGGLEIQSVYISGNVRKPFTAYMENPLNNYKMNWPDPPRADYLSSYKRLAHQLIVKGRIFKIWNKKLVVAVHEEFDQDLLAVPQVSPALADIIWLVYSLDLDPATNIYNLSLKNTIFTDYASVVAKYAPPSSGVSPIDDFLDGLYKKLQKLKRSPSKKRKSGQSPALPVVDADTIDTE
jgi:hypothetical protein